MYTVPFMLFVLVLYHIDTFLGIKCKTIKQPFLFVNSTSNIIPLQEQFPFNPNSFLFL